MPQELKRYWWVVRLAFIAAAAYFLARSVNAFVGAAIEPAPVVVQPEVPRGPSAPAQATPADATRFGHLFGIEPPPPPPPDTSQVEKANTNVCWTCEPVKTNLRVQLLATLVANQKPWSLALMTDLDKQETKHYIVGEKIKNAAIIDIKRDPERVIVLNEETHRLEYIDSVPGSGAAVNTAGLGSLGTAPVASAGGPINTEPGNAEPNPDGSVEGVTMLAENNYKITRQKLDSTLSNLNEVATQARIVPSFKNGVANGFKLFSIRPGSIYSGIGVQNGDVITRINGYDINSPDKALEIYSRLKDSRNIEIDLERRGTIVKKKYAIE